MTIKRPKNLGWRCTHCDKGRYLGKGSADKAVAHIREKHPARYESGDWAILPIRYFYQLEAK